LYRVKFWDELCNTPEPMRASRLDTTVFGTERADAWPAPTAFGMFDVRPLGVDEHGFRVLVEFMSTGRHDGADCSLLDGNKPAKLLTSPGNQLPIELRITRRIRDDTNNDFAILELRPPA